jgi:hypothetical protein
LRRLAKRNLISTQKLRDENCYSQGFCALALVFAALGVPAQEQTGNDIVIRNVRVFDGESVINNTSVLITNGKVAAMGASLSTVKLTQALHHA